ncbi:MAG: phosphatase PAP2 family protein [Gammaproteobacteria bacterium]
MSLNGLDCTQTIVPYAEDWIIAIANLRKNALTPIFQLLSNLIQESTILMTVALGYWFISKRVFYRVGLLSLFSLGINIHLKGIIMECRPMKVEWLEAANGYSFPSGHSQAASTLFGSIAQVVKSKWAVVTLITLPFLIALSRNYLGVHYVHDVTIGLLIGFSLVLIPWPTAWFTHLSLQSQIAMMLMFLLIWGWVINSPTGGSWKYTGYLFGFWLGGQLERRYLNFKSSRGFWMIFHGLLGIGIAVLLRKGAAPLLNWVGLSLTHFVFAQFCLLGLWISFLAPWLFSHLSKRPIQ